MDSGLELFIAASVDYDELNSVKYEADNGRIMLETAVDEELSDNKLEEITEAIKSALNVYCQLSNRKPRICQVQSVKNESLCFFRLYRDVDTLSLGEIQTYIDLLQEELSVRLITGCGSWVKESDKSQIKKKLLYNMSELDSSHQYFAHREDGRVRVFNK